MRGHAGTLSSEPAYGFWLLSYRVILLHNRRERYTLRTHCLNPYLMTNAGPTHPWTEGPGPPSGDSESPRLTPAHLPRLILLTLSGLCPSTLTRGPGLHALHILWGSQPPVPWAGDRSPPALGPITMLAGVSLRYLLPASLLRRVPGEETGSECPTVTTLSCSRRPSTCV